MRFTDSAKYTAVLLFCSIFLASCFSPNSQNTNSSSPRKSSNDEVETKKVDPFSEGVNKASNAAKLSQTAQALDDWTQVKVEWQAAIDLMQSVPSSSSNYQVARQRAEEYLKNLANAKQTANQLHQEQAKMRETQIARGKTIFTSLNGISQTAGEATSTPVVSVIIPQKGWDKISEADQISLTVYAESLISVVKTKPSDYISIPSTAPIYKRFINNLSNLCQDCWSITLSYKDSQPYSIDKTVVQGNTPWKNSDPCCRGIKSSDFRK